MTTDWVLLLLPIFVPLAAILDVPDAQLRANLVAAQFVGLALLRYVGRLEPLASADIETIVAVVGPTVQRYLTGDLGSADRQMARSLVVDSLQDADTGGAARR